MADGDIVETWVVPVSFLVVGAKVVDEKVRPVGVIPGVLDVCSSKLDVCPEVVEVCLSEVDICLESVDEGGEVIGSVVPVGGGVVSVSSLAVGDPLDLVDLSAELVAAGLVVVDVAPGPVIVSSGVVACVAGHVAVAG